MKNEPGSWGGEGWMDKGKTRGHFYFLSPTRSETSSFCSPPAFSLSQHQGLLQWLSSSHQVAKVLEFQFQHQYFQWTFWTDFPLGLTGLISLQSKGLSRVFSNTTVQNHQFFSSLYSPTIAFFIVQLSHPYRTTGKTIALTRWTFEGKFSIFIKILCCIVNS